MKKKFMVLAVMGLLAVFGGIADAAADVAINETNFPDAYFRDYVRTNFDSNKDGTLSWAEIQKANEIIIEGEYIGLDENHASIYRPKVASLKGIEYLTQLSRLECSGNQLKELDVSHNPSLQILWCGNNQLEKLDVSNNLALGDLFCSFNQLRELDITHNSALHDLICAGNHLTMLDMSKNLKLERVSVSSVIDEPIEALQTKEGWQIDLSKIVDIKDLDLITGIEVIDFSKPGKGIIPATYKINSTGILTFTCEGTPDIVSYLLNTGSAQIDETSFAGISLYLERKACSHSFGSYVTTTEPTVDKPGVATRTCTVCGTIETKELPKLKGTIKLSSSTLTVSVKQTVSAKALVGGMQKGDAIKKWQSANTKIATVDKNGNITGVAAGKVKIRVKLKSGASAILKVTVQGCSHSFGAYVTTTEPTVLKAGVATRTCSICGATETKEIPKLKGTVKLSTSSLSIQLNRTISLKALVGGMQKGDAIKTWQSADKRIATVDKNGNITGVAAGRVKIRVKLKSGASAILKVTVHKGTVATEAIQGLNKKLAVAAGKTVTLKPQLKPASSTQKITYRSSDNKIVTVDANGVVKGVKAGTAKIQVKSGNVKFIIKVKVMK